MDISFRSCLIAGVATITPAAVALAPSVKEPTPAAAHPQAVQIASPPIKLAAQVQPTVTATNLPGLLIQWLQRITVPRSAGQPFPTPQFPPVVAPTSIGSSIIWVYNAVEPWVRYGFDLAAYAVGWIPYVGWLAPQITIFYNFGERIARSITYNVAHWLDGNISFSQGLVNVGIDTVNSFIALANDQLAFWLPPLPGTAKVSAAAVAQNVTTLSATPTGTAQVKEKRGAVEGEALGEQAAGATATKAKATAATTSSPTAVATQGEVRGAPKEKKTQTAKVDTKGAKGHGGQAAEATSGASASAATRKAR
jgi:hypothetical protein